MHTEAFADGLDVVAAASTADSDMWVGLGSAARELATPPLSLLKLQQPGVGVALRSALHMVGDINKPLSSKHKGALAGRYIHTRIAVDQHTAGGGLTKLSGTISLCFSQTPCATTPLVSTACQPGWPATRSNGVCAGRGRHTIRSSRHHAIFFACFCEMYEGKLQGVDLRGLLDDFH
jgi:hypothetical protein